MQRLTVAARAAAGPSNHPVILTFARHGYEDMLGNWLAWLQHSRVDTSRVLISTKKDSLMTVQAVAKGTKAVVLSLPPLSRFRAAHLDDKGRHVDKSRNKRAR